MTANQSVKQAAGGAATVPALRWSATEYRTAIRWQTRRAAAVAAGAAEEVVLILEHPPVYTLGRRGGRTHLLASEAALAARGAALAASDRGGEITFHGPGQLVVYPILHLRRRGVGIAAYLRMLEELSIACAAAFGVAAERRRGRRGCWAGERKLGSIGVRLSNGVSTHGLALNVSTDLRWFDAIRPCGIEGVRMTSLSQELGRSIGIDQAAEAVPTAFSEVFGLRLASVRCGERS